MTGNTPLSVWNLCPQLVFAMPVSVIGQNGVARCRLASGYVPWYGVESSGGVAGLTVPNEIGVVGFPIHRIAVTKHAVAVVTLLYHVFQSRRIIDRVRIWGAILI
jgi:hypothetical protein